MKCVLVVGCRVPVVNSGEMALVGVVIVVVGVGVVVVVGLPVEVLLI